MVTAPSSDAFPGLLFSYLLLLRGTHTTLTRENVINYDRTRANQQNMTIARHSRH